MSKTLGCYYLQSHQQNNIKFSTKLVHRCFVRSEYYIFVRALLAVSVAT